MAVRYSVRGCNRKEHIHNGLEDEEKLMDEIQNEVRTIYKLNENDVTDDNPEGTVEEAVL